MSKSKSEILQPKLDNFKKFMREVLPAEKQEELKEYENIGSEDIVKLVVMKLQPYMEHRDKMREPAHQFAEQCGIADEQAIYKISRYFEFFTAVILAE